MQANSKTVIALILLAATAVFSTASISTNYGGKPSQATPIKFVGTFYAEGGRVVSYHSDGTLTLVNADMFSDDPTLVTGGRKTTPFLGIWRKVGARKIQAMSLDFATEAFGHNYGDAGFILKTTWTAIFDKPVNGVSPGYTTVGDTVVEVFLPDQNPTSDVPVSVITVPAGRGDRLTFE